MKTFIIKEEDCVRTAEGWELDVRVVIVPEEVEPPVEPPIEPPIEPPVEGDVLNVNFDNDNIGTYTNTDLRDHWDTTSGNVGFLSGTTKIVDDPNGTRGKVMSVYFKEGVSQYRKGGCCSGTQWMTPLKKSDEFYLSYDVMFEPGFDFGRGGKLPGLFGGDTFISGGDEATGYEGWSGRLMFKEGGGLTAYVYHAAKSSGKWGEDHKWKDAKFVPGRWHNLETRYVMNTPGVANGRIQGWFDGKLALDEGGFLFTKTDAISINGLIITTFFGGSWASPKDQSVYWDNFVVSTEPISH